jgi:hypothetical protein
MESTSTKSPDCLSLAPSLSPSPRGHLHFILEENGLELTTDGRFIRWSASNPKHPRNWRMPRKIYDSSLIIFLDFFTQVLYSIAFQEVPRLT